ncbi:VCBS repeat-containing protein [Cohnella xylanilytica]|uniref:VCBS repeat-containing protein n=1 Tax=Cohnella xylanilytica TaxID=557555 RepID=A0A841TUL3_9BACL|nr:FG-GAP-like repeat-containing protein [Cohnella xylanilytica]MBB6689843.1 VCBS repeat-containing protein [Cohnella xylanilytica]
MRDRASRWMKRSLPVALAAAAFAGPAPHGMAEPKLTFQEAVNVYYGSNVSRSSVGDLNNDGHQDLILMDLAAKKIVALIGNGDGTFQPPLPVDDGKVSKGAAIADFDGDGYPDVAYSNASGNSVVVRLGNGDGTFRSGSTSPVGSEPLGMKAADLNADGIPDLAVANNTSGTVSILLGNGDGSFYPAVDIAVDSLPRNLEVKDFNGDGIVDIAVTSNGTDRVNILLSTGDGFHFTRIAQSVGNSIENLTSGDFNSDGKPDLAFAVNGENKISVVLGTGSGTFTTPQWYDAWQYPIDVVTGDFNGDGILDLVGTPQTNPNFLILLGKGDGTFTATVHPYPVNGNGSIYLSAGDFNEDGISDVVFTGLINHAGLLLSKAEGTLAFEKSDYEAAENAGTVSVTVKRTDGTHGRTTIAYTTSDGTATSGDDYVAASGALVFEDDETSKTIDISLVNNDSNSPTARRFGITLSQPSNGALLGAQATATVSILEDDPAPDTSAPVVDAAKFSAVDNYSGTPDRLEGAAGAVGEADADVRAYAWNDADSDGVVDAGELGSPIALGVSAADGSVAAADIGDLPPGAYRFVVTATDAAGNESARDPGSVVAVTLVKGDEPLPPDTSAPVVDAAKFSAVDNYSGTPDRLEGAAGAVGEADADVRAYAWNDADSDGVVDAGELGSPIALGVSAAEGSVAAADIGDLPPGAYRFVVTATDAAGNESARDPGSVVAVTLVKGDEPLPPDTSAPVVDAAKFSAVDNYSGTHDRLAGAAGAVGEADANVAAYPWNDADSDGVVDAGELGSPIALGVSAADGSVVAADIGDLPPGAYKFVVTARDAAGNESPRDASTVVAVTLVKGDEPPPPDTSAPVVDAAKFFAVDNYNGTPDRLAGAAGAVGEADADVRAYAWNDADSDGVVDAGELGSPIALGVSAADGSVAAADIGDLPPGTYRFVVSARDAAGNESPGDASAVIAVTLAKGDEPHAPDTSAPVVDAAKFFAEDNYNGTPDRLMGAAGAVGEADANVAAYPWTDADSDGVVDSGELSSPIALGVSVADGSVPGADIGDLPPGAYRFVVTATDAAGNESPRDADSAVAITLTKGDAPELPEPDTSAPTWPEGGKLAASRILTSSLTLTWPSASDNVGTTGYEIFKDGIFLTSTDRNTASFKVTGLKAGTKYVFSVRALDASGNRSEELAASVRTTSGTYAPVLSSDSKLHTLSLTVGGTSFELAPAFDPDISEYRADTAEARIVLRFEANAAAKVRINGQDVSGVYEALLQPGDNLLTFDIQAENGESRTYRVTVVRHVPDPGPELPAPFGDMVGHWAEASIREAASLGLIKGDDRGNFRPDDEVTRSEWLVMLSRALKLQSSSPESALPFSDAGRIPAWARDQIASAVSSGIANGYTDGSFRPLAAVSRAEFAAILARSLHWEPQTANAPAFADASDIPAWALPSVQAAVQHGALEGRSGGRFEPNATATRAEAATILTRLSKLTDPKS